MYRDDREALQHRVDSISDEADRLRKENDAMRLAVGRKADVNLMLPSAIYRTDIRLQPLSERARLAQHNITRFPVWAMGVLNIATFGLFPMIHFGLMHNRLPSAALNDPSAGKAIGFQFIPCYSLYWVFFSALRLADRLNLQLRLRNKPVHAPKGLLIAACIGTVFPYAFFITLPTLWTIAVCRLQSTANKVAALDPMSWDAEEYSHDQESSLLSEPSVAMAPVAKEMKEEMVIYSKKAKKLVRWSHGLGWGGLGMLVVGTTIAAVTMGPVVATVVGVASGATVIGGAIVGQIGRSMQGRVI